MFLTIALLQMNVVAGQPQVNLARVQMGVQQAAEAAADLVVLPELWASGYDLAHAAQHADVLGTGLFAQMAALAQTYSLHLAGSLLERRGEGFFNTAVLYGPGGDLAGHYSKVHLFRLMDEHQYLQAGNAMPLFDLPWGRTALAICYDLRFPEIFRHYAQAGAALVVVPAQWPVHRIEHWRTLVRARAIENQTIVAACNRVGQDSDHDAPFGGCSVICDAWGRVVVEGDGNREALLTGRVDFATVAQARSLIPVFEDRRPDLYEQQR
jgi:omega-amidase